MYILLWAQCLQAPLHTVSVAAGVCPQMQSGTNNKCIIISLLCTGKVLLPFLSDPLPFLSFYFLFLYMDNWSKSLEMMNKWMICYNGFPLGSFAQGNIYIARAPGRLNVMGGNAGYSGSLVLQVCSIVEKEMLASIFDFLELEIWLWKGWRMQLLLDQMLSEAWRTYFWLIVNRPMNFFCNVCNVMTAMALCTDEALCHGSYLFRVEFW